MKSRGSVEVYKWLGYSLTISVGVCIIFQDSILSIDPNQANEVLKTIITLYGTLLGFVLTLMAIVISLSDKDIVIGIAASGTTPYVIKTLEKCQENNITTSCITCNLESPLAQVADYPIEVVVGPEFVTGSSRMKAGTAQKLVLNMISTSSMIQIGRVKGNKMVDMKMTNAKLQERGIQMIIDELQIEYSIAAQLLKEHQNVRTAIEYYKTNI